jgi:hypothetical protein
MAGIDDGITLSSTINRFGKRCFFKGLSLIERKLSKNIELEYSPTFIVAPPRSGTTVTRQLVAWAVPTSYFSNLTMMSVEQLGYPLPWTTALLAKRLRKANDVGSFESEYSYMPSPGAPAEGELVWGHWFRKRYAPVAPEELTAEQQRAIYQAVAATEQAFQLPFVNKSYLKIRETF